MRVINNIVLHCTATATNATVEAIQKYWRVNLKWKSPGYHYLIEFNGTVHNLLPEDQVSNGVAGHNHDSIHISYIGGVEKGKAKDTRSAAQIAAQINLLKTLKAKYPNARILGHRDFPGVAKDCPSFNVAEWLKTIKL